MTTGFFEINHRLRQTNIDKRCKPVTFKELQPKERRSVASKKSQMLAKPNYQGAGVGEFGSGNQQLTNDHGRMTIFVHKLHNLHNALVPMHNS